MKRRAIIFGLIGLMILSWLCSVAVEDVLPPLIRLHVLANSDTREDQELKYLVRDEVIATMEARFQGAHNLQESRRILLASLDDLEEEAQKVIKKSGKNYQVQAIYGQFNFPTKFYGKLALPAGRYEAVRLVIGEGLGANWWCVLFPPLCFVEEKTQQVTIQDEGLADKENITAARKIVKIKPAFKVVEMWKDTIDKIAGKQ